MNMKNKKGSELVTNKLIILILVVLVVIVILVFAFRSDTLNWIKNLPGFKAPVDSEIDLTKVSPSELANMGYTCEGDKDVKVGIIGPKATGNFVYQMAYDVRYLYMFDVMDFNAEKGLTRVGLQVDVNNLNAKTIDLTEGVNINVGNILGRAVLINKEMYKPDSTDTQKVLKYINGAQIRRLDGSYTVGGNLICKDKIQIAKEGQAVPLYYSGFNLVPEGKLLRIYKDGGKTKFYKDGDYMRYDLSWRDNFWKAGWNEAVFSVDKTGRIFYTYKGAKMIEEIKSEGDSVLLEDLRKSKIKDNTLVPDEEIDTWDVVGRIVYESPYWGGSNFYVHVTRNIEPSSSNLYYDTSTSKRSGPQLVLSYKGTNTVVPFSIEWQSGALNGLVGMLHLLITNQSEYDEAKKTNSDLMEYSALKALDGATYNFGKQVIYKIKTTPATSVPITK